MGAVKQWQIEKLGHAEDLYAALVALVGDVEALCLTSASLSWRTPAGVQGHWREEGGQFWCGRIVWDHDGRRSEQLVLMLDSVGEDDERIGLAHPTAHHCRSTDGPVVGFNVETPQIYEAAQCLLTQLGTELREMLLHLGEGQEATDAEDAA